MHSMCNKCTYIVYTVAHINILYKIYTYTTPYIHIAIVHKQYIPHHIHTLHTTIDAYTLYTHTLTHPRRP